MPCSLGGLTSIKHKLLFLSGALLILAIIVNLAGYIEVRQVILVITTVVAGVPIFIKVF